MLKLLEKFDQFGAAFQPRIQYSKTQHKTILGGIMSILLYGTSLIYLIYLTYNWINGNTLPKITLSSKQALQKNYTINETYLQFSNRLFNSSQIDPFNPEALILQPAVTHLQDGQVIQSKQSIQFEKLNGYYQLNFSDLELSLKSEAQPQLELMIRLGKCQAQMLVDGQKCANQSLIDAYFKQKKNVILVKQFLKEFNTQTQIVETIGREYNLAIQDQSTLLMQIEAKTQINYVDTGILFEEISFYEFIQDYRMQSSNLNLDYFRKITYTDIYFVINIRLDKVQTEQLITYPKISEVLAEANSIASTLFLLSYFVVMINQNQLEIEAINNVIGMYFPDFKKIKVFKNVFGRVKKIEKEGKQLDLKSFESQYERLVKIGQAKLSISNQIYEISRIQFILQSLFTTAQIKEYHSIGIPLQSIFVEPSSRDDSGTFKLEVMSLSTMFKSPQVVFIHRYIEASSIDINIGQ